MRKGLPILLALLLASTAPGLRAESLDRAELARLTRTWPRSERGSKPSIPQG